MYIFVLYTYILYIYHRYRLGGQSIKYNIGTKILMSQYIDHAKTFPDMHSKIPPDRWFYKPKAIVLAGAQS